MKEVLIADDTKNIRMLLGKCLQLEGWQTAEAADGAQALQLLRSRRFNLAFLDIKMPGLSGTEVLRTARAAGVLTPVVIITAYATVKNAVECTQMGAVAYLQKPFTADKVRNVLAEIMPVVSAPAERPSCPAGPQEALAALKRALAERPLDASIYLRLARASEQAGLAGDAEKYLRIHKMLSD